MARASFAMNAFTPTELLSPLSDACPPNARVNREPSGARQGAKRPFVGCTHRWAALPLRAQASRGAGVPREAHAETFQAEESLAPLVRLAVRSLPPVGLSPLPLRSSPACLRTRRVRLRVRQNDGPPRGGPAARDSRCARQPRAFRTPAADRPSIRQLRRALPGAATRCLTPPAEAVCTSQAGGHGCASAQPGCAVLQGLHAPTYAFSVPFAAR
jgi:hypothetical protein